MDRGREGHQAVEFGFERLHAATWTPGEVVHTTNTAKVFRGLTYKELYLPVQTAEEELHQGAWAPLAIPASVTTKLPTRDTHRQGQSCDYYEVLIEEERPTNFRAFICGKSRAHGPLA
jgi:hypothetical protein